MPLFETLVGLIFKEGGTAAIKKVTSEIEKKSKTEQRAEKKQWAEEMGSVITRSIISGDSTLKDPLRALILEFRNLASNGVSTTDGATVLDLIAQKEAQDIRARNAEMGRDAMVMYSPRRASAGGPRHSSTSGRVAYKRAASIAPSAIKTTGIKAPMKSLAAKKTATKRPAAKKVAVQKLALKKSLARK